MGFVPDDCKQEEIISPIGTAWRRACHECSLCVSVLSNNLILILTFKCMSRGFSLAGGTELPPTEVEFCGIQNIYCKKLLLWYNASNNIINMIL